MKKPLFLFLLLSIFSKVNSQEAYTNDIHNISLFGPKDWHITKNKDSRDINDTHGQKTLITYYKMPNNFEEKINPTINIVVVKNRFKTMEKFYQRTTKRNYFHHLKNYSIKEKPKAVNIGGKKGVLENVTYTIINEKDEHLNVKKSTYIFPTKEDIFYICLIDDKESNENLLSFNALVQSIKILQ